jgi:hypothetical protein
MLARVVIADQWPRVVNGPRYPCDGPISVPTPLSRLCAVRKEYGLNSDQLLQPGFGKLWMMWEDVGAVYVFEFRFGLGGFKGDLEFLWKFR